MHTQPSSEKWEQDQAEGTHRCSGCRLPTALANGVAQGFLSVWRGPEAWSCQEKAVQEEDRKLGVGGEEKGLPVGLNFFLMGRWARIYLLILFLWNILGQDKCEVSAVPGHCGVSPEGEGHLAWGVWAGTQALRVFSSRTIPNPSREHELLCYLLHPRPHPWCPAGPWKLCLWAL